jgi:hypothetical protein
MAKKKKGTGPVLLEKQGSINRWIITSIFGLFALQIATIAIIVTIVVPGLSEGSRDYEKTYRPIFRQMLIDKAYGILSDIHLTELEYEIELKRNISEIKESLFQIRAFDKRNKGLLEIFKFVESISKDDSSEVEDEFLRIDPTRDNTLQMTPQERGFLATFQGLAYIRKMRTKYKKQEYMKFLKEAKRKLVTARRLNAGISNMWNGLGICLMEEVHLYNDFTLIPEARMCFQYAFDIHRSPINIAAKINNLFNVFMFSTFFSAIDVIINEEDGSIKLSVRIDERLKDFKEQLERNVRSIDAALSYDPYALSIYISKAEALCTIALLEKAIGLKKGEEIVFDKPNHHLERAMEIIREVHMKGFRHWAYLFSRHWISKTLLRVSKYRKELISYIKP